MTDLIYAPWNEGLGDQIATMNLLAFQGLMRNKPVLLHSPAHLAALHAELRAELTLGSWITLTSQSPTERLSGYDIWAAPSAPTQIQWSPYVAHNTITYQFDGISSALSKNPTLDEERTLVAALNASGFNAVRLDRSKSIRECLDRMRDSVYFLGVDSGMSHLAHCVGVPTFLLEFTLPVVTCHRGKAYIQCGSRHEGRFGVEDFLRHKMPTHIDYLRAIGHPDGERSTLIRPRAAREALERDDTRWWLPVA